MAKGIIDDTTIPFDKLSRESNRSDKNQDIHQPEKQGVITVSSDGLSLFLTLKT